MQAIAQYWANIGVKVNILQPATTQELFADFLSRDAYLLEYSSTASPLFTGRLPSQTINPYHVVIPSLDNLIVKSQTAPPATQQAIWYQVEQITANLALSAPIATLPVLLYADHKVNGVEAKDWGNYSPISQEWTPAS
jgi:ABC-type transport system substrate-binding protein